MCEIKYGESFEDPFRTSMEMLACMNDDSQIADMKNILYEFDSLQLYVKYLKKILNFLLNSKCTVAFVHNRYPSRDSFKLNHSESSHFYETISNSTCVLGGEIESSANIENYSSSFFQESYFPSIFLLKLLLILKN